MYKSFIVSFGGVFEEELPPWGCGCVFMEMTWIYDVTAIMFAYVANPSEIVFD